MHGLVDWVALDRIHSDVGQSNPRATLPQIREDTLDLVRSLVEPRLFELGEVTDTEVFSPWTESLDQAMEKLRHTYVENFAAEEVWPWCCRLNLTPEGERRAQSTQQDQ
jgi:hypothetical protein